MRIILYTGKGGVGKTSVAAATAVKSAGRGLKTLVVSTDPAHSLGDSFDIKLSPEPLQISENLWAQEIDSVHEAEQGWRKIQEFISTVFTSKAVNDITAEELSIFPGIEDLLSLLRILRYHKEKSFDVIIIDCAPTGETLAFLSYPDLLRWWMEKLFPIQKKALKIVRPIAGSLLGVPMPSDSVVNEIENLFHQLSEMREILSNREITSVRIVVNPEKMVVKEAQRSFAYLNLYDYNIDAVVVNRVIPDNVSDNYFKVWKDIQKKYKETIINSFSPLPIYYAPLFEREIVGLEMLEKMGKEVFNETDPTAISYTSRTQQVTRDGEEYILTIYMPFTDKKEISLNQKGDELIIKVGNVKRNIVLPRTLLNLAIQGAKFENEMLKIRFGGAHNE
ncbi:MAG: ArsA family ATPase [Clostridia bacterium]|nr:ArsA family ATPase [Clostridia bacterium]